MNTYQTKLVKEHQELVERIVKLQDYVYGPASDVDNKVEFANKCIQLAAMKKYEEALHARLNNAGVICEDGRYYGEITPIETETVDNRPVDTNKPMEYGQ